MAIAIVGLVAVGVGLVISRGANETDTAKTPTLKIINSADLIAGHTFVTGNPDAPIEVVIFTDFIGAEDRAYILGAMALAQRNPKYIKVAMRPGKFDETTKAIAGSLQVATDTGAYQDLLAGIIQTNWENITETKQFETKLKELIERAGMESNLEAKSQEKHYRDLLKIDEKDAKTLHIMETPTIYVDGDLREFPSPDIFVKYLEERIQELRAKDYKEKQQKVAENQQANEDIPESTDIIRRLVLMSKPEELTDSQKKQQKTPLNIAFSDKTGWTPKEAKAVRGQIVRWHNATNEEVHIRALDTIWSGLESGFTIPANGTFEYSFDQKGLFRYEDKENYFWGVVIIE